MTVEEACLVLRGWADSKARLRVLLRALGTKIFFAGFCSLIHADEDTVALWVENTGKTCGLEISLDGCTCEFVDAPEENREHPKGGAVESCILALCPEFECFFMCMSDE